MVADRELIRLLSHASGTYHWDVESTAGIDAFGEGLFEAPQVVQRIKQHQDRLMVI